MSPRKNGFRGLCLRFILSGLGSWYRSWKMIEEAVPRADDLGFWGFVMPDHYMWGEPFGRVVEQPNSTLDTWVALHHLAAKTSRVKLGTLVTPIPFRPDRKSTRLNSSHSQISYAVFCLKKKK